MDGSLDLEDVVLAIHARRRSIDPRKSVLVGISGIDGSGKGYVAARLAERLSRDDVRAAVIGGDAWLNLPEVRFGAAPSGGHFYERAFRFGEMFERLIEPLRAARSVDVVADFAEEAATSFRSARWCFEDVDVILLEGIFLFRRELRAAFDLAVWVDCSFETALDRALARGQERLPAEETIRAYESIYFPAQRLHFERDRPKTSADLLLVNDPRLTRG